MRPAIKTYIHKRQPKAAIEEFFERTGMAIASANAPDGVYYCSVSGIIHRDPWGGRRGRGRGLDFLKYSLPPSPRTPLRVPMNYPCSVSVSRALV